MLNGLESNHQKLGYYNLITIFSFYVLKLNLLSLLFPRELGYKSYDIEDNTNLLYWPLVNVYFGAAYAKWLFSCDDKYAFHLVHCVLLILSSPISQQLECNYILQMLQTKNGRICC